MKLGLQVANLTFKGGPAQLGKTLRNIAVEAEQAGFHSLWVMDHFFQIEYIGPAEMDMLEGYSILSHLAAVTDRIKLGTLVTGITYRHPGILAKIATTLDLLSGGRSYFGIGAAWFEREHKALGVPFPPIAERFERLEEVIQIAKQMWSDNNGPYAGKHYQLTETLCVPQPLTRPHPPILIGGSGERKTLKLVARYAQACNLFQASQEVLAHKLDVLRQHCQDEGTAYDAIEKTTIGALDPSKGASACLATLQQLRDLGIDQAIIGFADVDDPTRLEWMRREILPAVNRM